jgi:hypothetical protein
MGSKGVYRPLGATDSRLKPGDYSLGSPQSRAAARPSGSAEGERKRGHCAWRRIHPDAALPHRLM